MMLERFLPLLAAAVIAVAVTILSTSGLPSPFTSGTAGEGDADASTSGEGSAASNPTSIESDEAALRVHPLLPASLRPGGTHRLILQLSGSTLTDIDHDDLIEVTFTVEEARAGVWVRPEHHILPRGSLQRTRFEIGLHPDVSCEAELGDLHVAVRDLAEDGALGETTVAMPPVDCTDPPPSSPDSVHVTDPVCGDDWREELEALKDGDELDPERCTEERWGEEPGSRQARPPARPTPRAEAPEEEAPEEAEEPPEETEEPPEETEEPPEEAEEPPEEAAAEEPADEPETPAEEPPSEESSNEPPSEESSDEAPEGASEESGSENGSPEERPSEE
jgi:hypothetical protein